MKQNTRNYILGFGLITLILLCIIGLRFYNNIYIWYLGDVDTMHAQAVKYYKEKKYEDARLLFTKLAGIDTASHSQYMAGDMYFKGLGGNQDYKKALRFFLKSAENENANAQNNLGYMYTYGVGVEKDYSKAKNYLQAAAVQGNSTAQVGLGSLYRHGWGVERS